MPLLGTLRRYRVRWLRRDLVAAVAVGTMLVPQGMAFASVAGAQPAAGLWTAAAAAIGYALFGSSRQLMVGPEAGVAVLLLAILGPLRLDDPEEYAVVAAAVSIGVALLLFVSGLLRLGAVADLLSRPLLVGYLNGVALIIVASQLAAVTGLPPAEGEFFGQVAQLVARWGEVHLPTLWVAAGSLLFLVGQRFVAPRFPGSVVVMVATTALSASFDFAGRGVELLEPLPVGLPRIGTPPRLEAVAIVRLLPGILGVTLLVFVSSLLTARAFADKNGYRVDADREFFGLAAANLLAGIAQGFPVAGSDSRTAVNDASGGRTQLASLLSAGVVLVVLAFLLPTIAWMPCAALGAIVIAAGIFLVDARAVVRLARVRPSECAVALLTTAAVLFFGIAEGILLAVAMAAADLVRHAARPHGAILGRVEGKIGYHGIDAKAPSFVLPGLLIYRVDGPLFFANARYLRERILELVEGVEPRPRLIVLDAGAIFDLDFTAAAELVKFSQDLEERGTDLAVAEPHEPIRRVLRRTGLLRELGKRNVFPTVEDAVRTYLERERAEGRRLDWESTEDMPFPFK